MMLRFAWDQSNMWREKIQRADQEVGAPRGELKADVPGFGRGGMTLIEIMVAIAIFLFVSIAMLTIFSSASNLFNRAESSRQANDEAMAIFSQLEKDLAAAVPPRQGGQFWAKLNPKTGGCITGWTISDPSSDSGFSFVVWGHRQGTFEPTLSNSATAGTLFDWELRRIVMKKVTPVDIGTYPGDTLIGTWVQSQNPSGSLDISMSVLGNGIPHFGVWLSGTDTNRQLVPHDSLWHRMSDVSGSLTATLPSSDTVAVSTFGDGGSQKIEYPAAVRFTLITGCGQKHLRRGRIINDTGTDIQIAGLTDIPSLPGTVAIIPFIDPDWSPPTPLDYQYQYRLELVGIQGRSPSGNLLDINSYSLTEPDKIPGPLHLDFTVNPPVLTTGPYAGRFAMRGTIPDPFPVRSSSTNNFIFIGTQYSLVRALPVE